MKMPQIQSLRTPRRRLCASLRDRMHMDMSQEPFCARIYRKNAAHKIATNSLREPAPRHFTRAISRETLQEKCRAQRSRSQFVQACAFEMHMESSHAAPQDLGARFVQACAVEMHLSISVDQTRCIVGFLLKGPSFQCFHHVCRP